MALTLNNFVGFETGGLEEASATAGAGVTVAGVRTGSYSLYFWGLGAISYDISPFESVASAGDDQLVGFWFKLSDLTPDSDYDFFEVRTSVGVILALRVEAASGDLILVDANGTEVKTTTGSPFGTGAWSFVELRWQNTGAGAADVYVDGVSELSVDSEDFDDGNAIDVYRLRGPAAEGKWAAFDDFYCYSGAAGVGDFLGDAEVFRYQADTANIVPDVGDILTSGLWQNLGRTPGDAAEAGYDGGALTGIIYSDDAENGRHYRHGPHGDGNIDGTIEGGKWLHQLKRGNGSGTNHYKRYGNDGDGPASPGTIVALTTAYQNFFTVSEAAAEVPLATEHFAHGFGKSAGGREILCQEIWAFILHVPSVVMVGPDEMMAAIGRLGALQPQFLPPEVVAY